MHVGRLHEAKKVVGSTRPTLSTCPGCAPADGSTPRLVALAVSWARSPAPLPVSTPLGPGPMAPRGHRDFLEEGRPGSRPVPEASWGPAAQQWGPAMGAQGAVQQPSPEPSGHCPLGTACSAQGLRPPVRADHRPQGHQQPEPLGPACSPRVQPLPGD